MRNLKPMEKILKKWNGRAAGSKYSRGSFYIAAYTKKQAAQIYVAATIGERDMDDSLSTGRAYREITEYFSQCWGNPMEGIDPHTPCIYYQKQYETPRLIYTLKP